MIIPTSRLVSPHVVTGSNITKHVFCSVYMTAWARRRLVEDVQGIGGK